MCNSASQVSDLLATANREHGRSTCDRQATRHRADGRRALAYGVGRAWSQASR